MGSVSLGLAREEGVILVDTGGYRGDGGVSNRPLAKILSLGFGTTDEHR
jgi:hypothetical protein